MLDTQQLPENYAGLRVSDSLEDLLASNFNLQTAENVVLFRRKKIISIHFNSLAIKIGKETGLEEEENKDFTQDEFLKITQNINLTPEEILARDFIIQDLYASSILDPILFLESPQFGQDNSVSKWHRDDSYTPSRLICSYNIAATEFLRNEEALPSKGVFYTQRDNSTIYRFRVGDISLHSSNTETEQKENVFIHRRPSTQNIQIPRLILIA